ncbi:unnamed protein product [Penicillium roqueforti FM164]|uniref:Genomic scaffold, ProqFM164S03 n=1 Tax=Penicillium roqueforti (strain FM164) TaxID=1365484 RepID=W6QIW3_PENRF|nr:unnamed protein product [Penicillium roqueforti FM164]
MPSAVRPSEMHTHVAIVGAGPRGTSVLERLCASAPEYLVPGARLTVHIVDPSPPGAGHVWRTKQSDQLLMNTVSSQVTLFTDDSISCSGPIRPGPSLYTWAADKIPGLGPDDCGTRAQYGQYLEWIFQETVRQAPPQVQIEVHPAFAVRLYDTSYGQQTLKLSNGRTLSSLAAVILAQGHVPLLLDIEQLKINAYAELNGLHHITPSNPADVDLSVIAPGENVFLRGLGLNFFDYMALLTLSRGGSFSETPNGLKYHPSGNEPRMIAGSRRGIPYHSRGDNGKGAYGRHMPLVFTEEVINAFRKHSDAGKAPDFLQDIWPLVSKEVETVYYLTLLKRDKLDQTDFQKRFLETEPKSPEEAQVLRDFGISEEKWWSWERIQRPQGDQVFNTTTEWREWLIAYLREDAKEAALGNLNGPLKAALDVMRDLRNELRLIVDHNGLTGASHRENLDRWYTPLNAYVSIGPPRQRIEQMIALMDAGVLEVLGPRPQVKAQDEAWLVPGEPIRVTTLIEARLPEPKLRNTGDELLSHLFKTGQCRAHTIDGYETGGLDVTQSPYHLIDTHGRAHPKRFAVGVPTEGVHWVTAAGARPGVNSVTLCDTDAVARAALSAAAIKAKITQTKIDVKTFPCIEVSKLRVHA